MIFKDIIDENFQNFKKTSSQIQEHFEDQSEYKAS